MDALVRAVQADGHTTQWWMQTLGQSSYRRTRRLLSGAQALDYETARKVAAALGVRFDQLFEPQPVKSGTRWLLRFRGKRMQEADQRPPRSLKAVAS